MKRSHRTLHEQMCRVPLGSHSVRSCAITHTGKYASRYNLSLHLWRQLAVFLPKSSLAIMTSSSSVLIVDDEAAMRDFMSRWVRALGMESNTAGSAEEAAVVQQQLRQFLDPGPGSPS